MKHSIFYIAAISLSMMVACSEPIPEGFKVDGAENYGTVYIGKAFHGNAVVTVLPDEESTFNVYANYGGLIDLKNPVSVTFQVETDRVTEYNSLMQTNYKLLPEESYSIDKLVVSIKEGKMNSEAMQIVFFGDKLAHKARYMLPISIAHVSDNTISVHKDLNVLYLIIDYDDTLKEYDNYNRTGWTVLASSASKEGYGPEKALDDNTDTWWECPQTLEESQSLNLTHSITVDMTKDHLIHGVGVHARTRKLAGVDYHYAGQPRQVELEISSDNEQWTKIEQSIIFPFGIINRVRFDEYYTARYIRMTVKDTWLTKQQRGCYLSLSEFNIF